MGPFHTTTFKDSADLNATDALLHGMAHSGLSVQIAASGMDEGRPTLITEAYLPLPGGDDISSAIINVSRKIASQPTYNDSDIEKAIAGQKHLFPAAQAGFLKKMLTLCISLDRQGARMNGFTIVQTQTPSGIAWRVADGKIWDMSGQVPFQSGRPAPATQDITGLVDFLRNGVASGRIPNDLFSMHPKTEPSYSSDDEVNTPAGQAVLQSLIPGSTIIGSGEDGFVLDIGGRKVMKAWHGNGHDIMAEWQSGSPPDNPVSLNRPNIEIMAISLLQNSEANLFVPEISTYGFAGPFRGMIRNNLCDVEFPLFGFEDNDHSYLTDVLGLAERLSYPETDPKRPDMSDDDIADELALIVARHEIEEGAEHDQSDPFMGRQFLDNMTVFFRESRRLGVAPYDLASTSNYGLDQNGNLRLRDLSRFLLKGPMQNGHSIYPGGYILGDVIAHGARVKGLIQTISPEKKPEPAGIAV